MKQTPLHDLMVERGGKMVDFAGFDMPVQFEGVIAEHKAVRNGVGVFDVSHMGEFLISGSESTAALERILTNTILDLQIGRARYSLMCNEQGGVVDDVLVYKMSNDIYMMVVNASNVDKDFAWIKAHLPSDVIIANYSDFSILLAIQGPDAEKLIRDIFADEFIPTNNYSFKKAEFDGKTIMISRTGYTGEDGFEVMLDVSSTEKFVKVMEKAGQKYNLTWCGLGARDTLRLEAAMPLYGHEMDDNTLATEICLSPFIKLGKPDFIGKAALEKQNKKYKRIGLVIVDRGIAREHSKVFCDGEEVGYVTSGTFSPTLEKAICMARVSVSADGEYSVEVRGKRLKAEKTTLPFYKRK